MTPLLPLRHCHRLLRRHRLLLAVACSSMLLPPPACCHCCGHLFLVPTHLPTSGVHAHCRRVQSCHPSPTHPCLASTHIIATSGNDPSVIYQYQPVQVWRLLLMLSHAASDTVALHPPVSALPLLPRSGSTHVVLQCAALMTSRSLLLRVLSCCDSVWPQLFFCQQLLLLVLSAHASCSCLSCCTQMQSK